MKTLRTIDSFFFFLLFLLLAVPITIFLIEEDPIRLNSFMSVEQSAAASFFSESVNTDDLKERYQKAISSNSRSKDRVKILIVPGHDEINYGTQFGNLKELELNRQLAEYMRDFFVREKGFRVVLAADRNGFNSKLERYLDREEADIKEFKKFYEKVTTKLENNGHVVLNQHVDHNIAPSDVIFMLYGINKFANDEDFDVVLHIHFNDYRGRNKGERGKYRGFSIYTPDKDFGNGEASNEIAHTLFDRLSLFFTPSTHPIEKMGVIEGSELIATGAFNTVDPIALLVEYGYIYEPQITNPELRDTVLREMAFQTFIAIKTFFEPDFLFKTNQTLLIPHDWKINLDKYAPQHRDILSLEALLKLEGFFPGPTQTLADCPIDGDFDDCTEESLLRFQNNYGLRATGALDESTKDFLNAIF